MLSQAMCALSVRVGGFCPRGILPAVERGPSVRGVPGDVRTLVRTSYTIFGRVTTVDRVSFVGLMKRPVQFASSKQENNLKPTMHYTRRLKSYPDITRPNPSPLGHNFPFHAKQDKPPAGFSRGGFGPLVAKVG